MASVLTQTDYIPVVYSPLMVAALYANTCLSKIANTNYEGEIKEMGNQVKIRITPHVTIRDYVAADDLIAETIAKASIDLDIDRGKYFMFPAEYVEVKQSDIHFVEVFAESAGIDMKVQIETDIFADIYSDAATGNYGAAAGLISGDINLGTSAAPLSVTKTTIIGAIADLSLCLDEQNVPEADRWLVLPSWAHSILIQHEEFRANSSGDDKSALRLGKVGNFNNFDIYKSNTLNTTATDDSTDGATKQVDIIAGHKDALTFASQLLITNEKIKSELKFQDYYRGLHVFGFKVCQPKSLIHAVWVRG